VWISHTPYHPHEIRKNVGGGDEGVYFRLPPKVGEKTGGRLARTGPFDGGRGYLCLSQSTGVGRLTKKGNWSARQKRREKTWGGGRKKAKCHLGNHALRNGREMGFKLKHSTMGGSQCLEKRGILAGKGLPNWSTSVKVGGGGTGNMQVDGRTTCFSSLS